MNSVIASENLVGGQNEIDQDSNHNNEGEAPLVPTMRYWSCDHSSSAASKRMLTASVPANHHAHKLLSP
ncbi:unnamed protein product [Schistocephalus solidus]|uniref:Ovule protein n=1 Tax=Schistocephalus solidus TaxID=70667 RepID=A0A183SB20_SCHSO|nr:unnamed protein product [Schistocephalus solidus]